MVVTLLLASLHRGLLLVLGNVPGPCRMQCQQCALDQFILKCVNKLLRLGQIERLEKREILKVIAGQQNKLKFKHRKGKGDRVSERDRDCFTVWVSGWKKIQWE